MHTAVRESPASAFVTDLPPVRLRTFEGPLDLLLHLVKVGQRDIFDLPIAELCDQYILYLRAMASVNLLVAGEFLVMAATLVEIKSRMLLPQIKSDNGLLEDGEDEITDPRIVLVQQLLEYGRYQAIGETLRDAETERKNLYFRERLSILSSGATTGFAIPPAEFGEQSPFDLLKTLTRLLANIGADEQTVTAVRRQKISLKLTMRLVLVRIRAAGERGMDLMELLPDAPFTRLDAILLFLAILELVKLQDIQAEQAVFTDSIYLFARPDAEQARAK